MTGHRIHQDQIRLMANLMRTLYNQKRTDTGTHPCQPEDKTPSVARNDTLMYQVRTVTPAKNNQALPTARRFSRKGPGLFSIAPEKILPGIKCPQCGELFPTSDFHYTEGTGLCIPCWEKGEIPCL